MALWYLVFGIPESQMSIFALYISWKFIVYGIQPWLFSVSLNHYCVITTLNRISSNGPTIIRFLNATQVYHGIWNQSTVKNLILLFTSFITKTLSPCFKFFRCMRPYRMFYKAFKGISVSTLEASQCLHLQKIIMIYNMLYPGISDTNINGQMSLVFMILDQCHWCLQASILTSWAVL